MGAETPVVAPVSSQVRDAIPQLSLIIGFGVAIIAVHKPGVLSSISSPEQFITGFSISLTVTVKKHVEVFPAASFAVYVIVVTPELNR